MSSESKFPSLKYILIAQLGFQKCFKIDSMLPQSNQVKIVGGRCRGGRESGYVIFIGLAGFF